MGLIDLHCDTINVMMDSKDDVVLKSNKYGVDITKLKKINSIAQFFACFIDADKKYDPLERTLNMIDKIHLEVEKNKDDIVIVKNYDELITNKDKNKISAILTIEGGEGLKGEISNLRNFYRLGVRLITFTWNYENELGYPGCISKFRDKGLKEKGKEVLVEMNRLGIIPDVSHLSDGGFYDVIKNSSKPIMASHSNARAITNHSRNLTDDMIKLLSEKGGVMGINFCPAFLSSKNKATVEDIVTHIQYIKNIGGIEVISVGTDFDGIDSTPGINNIGEMGKLTNELIKNKFTEDEIEKIFYKNALRVIKQNL